METEYEIRITAQVKSTLPKDKLKQSLVVALWDESTDSMTPDGAGDELEVIEYRLVSVEETDE